MGLAALERHESAVAANVGRGEPRTWGEALQKAREEVERQIVAADRDDRPLDLGQGSQKLHLYRRSRVESTSGGASHKRPAPAALRRWAVACTAPSVLQVSMAFTVTVPPSTALAEVATVCVTPM